MKKELIILLILFYSLAGCKKENLIKNINATIIDAGNTAADGCGWLIKIDASATSYHADNLPVDFQKDKLPVIVSYHLLNTKFSCGLLSNNISVINIDAIKKK